MKVALVCDFLVKFGGAQRVLLAMHEAYPEAPIFCLLYDEKDTKEMFKGIEIIPSRLQKLPSLLRKNPKYLLPMLPKAMEQFDFSKYDLVISSSDSYSHGIITKPSTFHVCYCHTPMRYAWDWTNEYLKENKLGYGAKGLLVRNFLHNLRIWDRTAADRVDFWIANSSNVKKRINKYYRNDAAIIYPPVEIDKIKLSQETPDDYYLIVSRLEPYKKIKLAVEAFNNLEKKLIVIGEGSQFNELKKIAKNNVKLLGWQSDDTTYKYLSKCKAFIFPGEDDFGITPVEAMASGRPVIAFRKGGVTESVIEGKTGMFFDEDNAESLAQSVLEFENTRAFNPSECRKQAERFSKDNFITTLKNTIGKQRKIYLENFSHAQKND